MVLSYVLEAIAGAVIGTLIGTVILGVTTSGFTFIGVDAYIQDMVEGMIIVAAVVADRYRQRRRRKT